MRHRRDSSVTLSSREEGLGRAADSWEPCGGRCLPYCISPACLSHGFMTTYDTSQRLSLAAAAAAYISVGSQRGCANPRLRGRGHTEVAAAWGFLLCASWTAYSRGGNGCLARHKAISLICETLDPTFRMRRQCFWIMKIHITTWLLQTGNEVKYAAETAVI